MAEGDPDPTVSVVIRHTDGTESAVPTLPGDIIYDETGTNAIGAVIPHSEKGDEFVKIEPISITNP